MRAVLLFLLLAISACSKASGELMSWQELRSRPKPEADKTIAYGPDPLEVVDLWLPKGPGPYPTVIMVHGGCWTSRIADRTIMNWAADDLRKRGIAVWNIEYRGVDRHGGYPGTFIDVASAADLLRGEAATYHLDLANLVAVGHSAGGHLALWLAARPRLPASSPLRSANPIAIRKVVSLGGLPDLEAASRPPGSGCGTEVPAQLAGGHFDETSVPRLAPIGVEQVLISGAEDRTVPPVFAEDYARPVKAAGDPVRIRVIEHSGHVELVAPGTAAWQAAVDEILTGTAGAHAR